MKLDWRILSWLRGLAALYVTINHCRGTLFSDSMMYEQHVNPKSNWAWWEWLQITFMNHTSLGSEFVVLFFLLSGFSIAHSLRGNTNTMSFYKRRLVRLYPPYLLGIVWSLVVILLIWLFVPDIFYKSADGWPPIQQALDKFLYLPTLLSNLAYMPKDNFLTNQYWTLPYEILFYLVAPLIARYMKTCAVAMFAMYTICLLLFGIDHQVHGEHSVFFLFGNEYGIYFIIGMLFYKFKDRMLSSFKLSKTFSFIAVLAVFEILVLCKGYMFGGIPNKLTGMLTVLLTYILLFSALKYSIRIPWLEKVGNYSYTLYVTHWATIYAVKIVAAKLGLGFYVIHNLFFWYTGVVACLAVGYVLYFVAERPSNCFVEKLRNKKASASPIKQPAIAVVQPQVA